MYEPYRRREHRLLCAISRIPLPRTHLLRSYRIWQHAVPWVRPHFGVFLLNHRYPLPRGSARRFDDPICWVARYTRIILAEIFFSQQQPRRRSRADTTRYDITQWPSLALEPKRWPPTSPSTHTFPRCDLDQPGECFRKQGEGLSKHVGHMERVRYRALALRSRLRLHMRTLHTTRLTTRAMLANGGELLGLLREICTENVLRPPWVLLHAPKRGNIHQRVQVPLDQPAPSVYGRKPKNTQNLEEYKRQWTLRYVGSP